MDGRRTLNSIGTAGRVAPEFELFSGQRTRPRALPQRTLPSCCTDIPLIAMATLAVRKRLRANVNGRALGLTNARTVDDNAAKARIRCVYMSFSVCREWLIGALISSTGRERAAPPPKWNRLVYPYYNWEKRKKTGASPNCLASIIIRKVLLGRVALVC